MPELFFNDQFNNIALLHIYKNLSSFSLKKYHIDKKFLMEYNAAYSMNKKINNRFGFIIAAIPLTLAIIGVIGTSAFANYDYQKSLVNVRDQQRKQNTVLIAEKLAAYYSINNSYPLQKNQADNGQAILTSVLGDIPKDPLKQKGWSYLYWSNEQTYTLRYILEATGEEKVIFGE